MEVLDRRINILTSQYGETHHKNSSLKILKNTSLGRLLDLKHQTNQIEVFKSLELWKYQTVEIKSRFHSKTNTSQEFFIKNFEKKELELGNTLVRSAYITISIRP